MPFFSVILATRDRPALFAEALASVLAQEGADYELIVVDDGSLDAHDAAYAGALDRAGETLGERLKVRRLLRRPRGHGQSYSLNFGADEAAGDYLAFLDDDDRWTDPRHLARAAAALAARPGADLFMTNQCAFRAGEPLDEALWLAPLALALAHTGRRAGGDGVWTVAVLDLLANPGFCHVNCLIVRRALWQAVGGMDEGIRWECDRDLYLRLIDAAGSMLHHPAFVAAHNIPDPAQGASMTTALPMLDKRLHQLRVVDKAALFARHPAIRAHGRRHRAFVLKKMAQELAQGGDRRAAAAQARLALGAGPGLKWLGATAWYGLRALFGGGRR
jgi:glycosyltransferase involved in cell wall biosynthesis